MKQEYCEKYFGNIVKPKHLSKFNQKTPGGHEISGYICRKPNQYLGSLIITHIHEKNGEEYDVEQFVQSFPKIHYWDNRRHRLKDDGDIFYFCDEKFDGTCLIIFALKDKNGEVLELIPKSRGQAVVDTRILDMYNLIDKKPIKEYFNQNSTDDVLMFELYGVLNKHEITYMDTYIDIVLIGAFVDGEFLEKIDILFNKSLSGFYKHTSVFNIIKSDENNEFSIDWISMDSRLKNYKVTTDKTFPTLYDAVQEIKSLLKQINDAYYAENKRSVIEGVVINGRHFSGNQMYLKIKPGSIVKDAKEMASVPRKFVLKEVQKYFDEYGSNIRELYEKDDTHYIKYVKHQLKEEFTYGQIEDPRTLKRIKNIFMEVWDSKIPPISIQNICEELIIENPDKSISELMKIFAKSYPSKKNQSRFVFNILTSLKKGC